MQADTEVRGAGVSVGVPTPEQAAKQAEWERDQLAAKIAAEIEAFDNDPDRQRALLIQLTGTATPNRAQRRAAEKRLRRQRRGA